MFKISKYPKEKTYILDGGLGSRLLKKGSPRPELAALETPEILAAIHREYIQSGSEIIFANTFGVNPLKQPNYAEIIKASLEIAKSAGNAYAALDIGPLVAALEPNGVLKFEEAYELFKKVILSGSGAGLIVFETFADLYELKAGLLAAKENSQAPVFATMTFERNGLTFLGVSLAKMAETLEGLGADAIGINCSLGPEEILPMAKELAAITPLPVIIKPNAGLPDPLTNEYNYSPKKFAEVMEEIYNAGVTFLGGCCGTTPEFISEISLRLKNKPAKPRAINPPDNSIKIIGERLNPTGKKALRQAILDNDLNYLAKQALKQLNEGAEILDVNIGVPGANEAELFPRVIKYLQSVTNARLVIDSSEPAAIAAALRVYNGKAIVNSVNGKDEVLREVLPYVKKYGAAVVGLTLDESGIPETAEGRLAIAEKILRACAGYGIDKRDLFIDCLTLTASAQQKEALETLRAITLVKRRLGLKTLLGVSNISFGLANRDALNRTFLAAALYAGLDYPIMNPASDSMKETIAAFNVLSYRDIGAEIFNSLDFSGQETYGHIAKKTTISSGEANLIEAIILGLKDEARGLTKEKIKTLEISDIIDNYLIKALDIVGGRFERGELYLPGLLRAAAAAQEAFEVIKENLPPGQKTGSKGKIVLATVKGDVHDIGKNIVKTLLANYGYEIDDLGKDAAPERILNAARGAKLVGLSALMTTTLKYMEETIRLIKKNTPETKIMVGGAVVTESYAKKINADYYAKDAKSGVDIAKEVFNQL